MVISEILEIFAQQDVPGLLLGLMFVPSEMGEKELALAHNPSLDKADSLAPLLLSEVERGRRGARRGAVRRATRGIRRPAELRMKLLFLSDHFSSQESQRA